MKIGINASFLRKPDSGIGQVTRNFLRKLRELKVESENLKTGAIKFILYLEEDTDLELPENFEKRVFLPGFYKRDDLVRKVIWEKWLLPKKAAEDKCDVLFSLYQSATRLKNIKHVVLVHDVIWKTFPQYQNNWRKKIYYRLVDKAIKKADGIITVSENSKKDIIKFLSIPEDKIAVNYIDCDEIFKNQELRIKDQKEDPNKQKEPTSYQLSGFAGSGEARPAKSYIFYVGGFDIRKNAEGLIESYGLLWKNWRGDKNNFPDLVLAGEFHKHLIPLITDVPEKIKEVCEKDDLPVDKIKMIGFVKQEDLPTWYKNAKLFCYPSFYEGFGLPLLEAMNCGCPIITSNTSSIPEVCSENSALLVNPENMGEIAEAMEKILTDENLKNNLIQKGYENAKRFSWEKFTKNVFLNF